jgi:CheY-like chemotaxis protein
MSARQNATVSSPRRTILIVEDDLETRLLYTSAFENSGFQTEQAHNGYQALEKALKTVPDLILTDIAVPGLDGIELCRRRLRADEAMRHRTAGQRGASADRIDPRLTGRTPSTPDFMLSYLAITR